MKLIFLKSAKYLSEFNLWLEFSDGVSGEMDFTCFFNKKPYHILSDLTTFKTFQVNEWTIFWDGIDIAPEYLYEEFQKQHALIKAM